MTNPVSANNCNRNYNSQEQICEQLNYTPVNEAELQCQPFSSDEPISHVDLTKIRINRTARPVVASLWSKPLISPKTSNDDSYLPIAAALVSRNPFAIAAVLAGSLTGCSEEVDSPVASPLSEVSLLAMPLAQVFWQQK